MEMVKKAATEVTRLILEYKCLNGGYPDVPI